MIRRSKNNSDYAIKDATMGKFKGVLNNFWRHAGNPCKYCGNINNIQDTGLVKCPCTEHVIKNPLSKNI